MDFTETIASFLSNLPLEKMSGQEKFLAVATYLSAGATTKVVVTDSYVDETIFDTVLDSIPKSLPIQLIYSHIPSANQAAFDTRQKRFVTEYTKYAIKKYKDLHDRFLIVDDRAYIIG